MILSTSSLMKECAAVVSPLMLRVSLLLDKNAYTCNCFLTIFPVALSDLWLLDYRKSKYFKTFMWWERSGAYLSTEIQNETLTKKLYVPNSL